MSITTNCQCGKKLRANDNAAGKTAKCPACGNTVTFPALTVQVEDDPFANPAREKPKEVIRPPEAGGNGRFLAIVSTLAVAVIVGAISLINWNINRQRKAEASEKLRQTMTEATQEANASILAGKFDKAAESLRKVVQPKPTVEPGDPNKALVDQAENLLRAVDTAATTPKAVAYLQRLDDGKLAAILNGQNELTAGISEPKVKKVIDDRFTRLVPPIQASREQIAQEKREQELAADPVYQRQQFLGWVDQQQQAILERDGELRHEIWSMELDYKTKRLSQPLTTRGIENVLDEWGEKREKMLAARTKEIGDAIQEFTQGAMRHPVWRAGTEEHQQSVADEFGKKLKVLVDLLEKPVENQLASLESRFGNRLERGVRQLDDLNAKMRDTTRYYNDMLKGRIGMPAR